jgi:RNA polymerase sigma-70 factor (ECF subfamily)
MSVGAVERMFEEGMRRWPGVTLSFAPFARHCSELFTLDGPTVERAGADLFLCCACMLGDPVALQAFEQEVTPVARAAVARVCRERDFAEETLQEVWNKLLCGPEAKVAKYRGLGPLQAWARVTATRIALDRCRARGLAVARQVELSDVLAAPERSAELALTRARYGEAFQRALREAVASLPLRERHALQMHVCARCSIDDIGLTYGVHRATAARWLEHARAAIVSGVRARLGERDIKLTDSEFISVARGLTSVLELRLSGSFLSSTEC